jgi:hypothetical protein
MATLACRRQGPDIEGDLRLSVVSGLYSIWRPHGDLNVLTGSRSAIIDRCLKENHPILTREKQAQTKKAGK